MCYTLRAENRCDGMLDLPAGWLTVMGGVWYHERKSFPGLSDKAFLISAAKQIRHNLALRDENRERKFQGLDNVLRSSEESEQAAEQRSTAVTNSEMRKALIDTRCAFLLNFQGTRVISQPNILVCKK